MLGKRPPSTRSGLWLCSVPSGLSASLGVVHVSMCLQMTVRMPLASHMGSTTAIRVAEISRKKPSTTHKLHLSNTCQLWLQVTAKMLLTKAQNGPSHSYKDGQSHSYQSGKKQQVKPVQHWNLHVLSGRH